MFIQISSVSLEVKNMWHMVSQSIFISLYDFQAIAQSDVYSLQISNSGCILLLSSENEKKNKT